MNNECQTPETTWIDLCNLSGDTLPQYKHVLETLFQTIPGPIFVKDTEGRYVGCNHLFLEQILGLPREDVVNRSPADLEAAFTPEQAALHHSHDMQLLNEPGVHVYETTMQCADEVQRTFRIHKATCYHESGEVSGIVGVMIDITERKHLEDMLERRVDRRTQQFFSVIEELEKEVHAREQMNDMLQYQANLIESVNDAIISTDMTSTIQSWNKAAETLYGWQASDVIGKKVADVLKTRDTGSRRHDVLERFFAQGFHQGEIVQERKDGSTIHVQASASVLLNQQGEPVGMVAVHRDITERKRTEEALRQSEERYRSLVETSPDAILLTDLSGIITFCNREAVKLFGCTIPDEIVGSPLLHFFAPEEHQRSRGRDQPTLTSDMIKHSTYTLVKQGGTRFAAELGSSVVLDVDGYPSAFLCIIRDITERLQMETMMLENARLTASMDLIAVVAHEVNTPLQTILSSMQLLRRMADEKQATFLTLAEKEIKRVGAIVTQLKDLYRPVTEEVGPVLVNDLLERVLHLASGKLVNQRIQVERNLADDLPHVQGRSDHLNQVFLNLIVNAIDALPASGRLSVATQLRHEQEHEQEGDTHTREPAAGEIIITIADNGAGIDPANLGHIFEPFFTTKEQGTGLGLFVSKKIVVDHGGNISVHSTPGEGTTFTICLPIGEQEPEQEQEQ